MTPITPITLVPLPRRDAAVASIVRQWRELTSERTPAGRLGSGEPTLVACSGGADSSALALALAAASRRFVLAHVVHDMRPPAEALADRDAVRTLALTLGVPFAESHVSLRTLTIDGASAPTSIIRRRGDHNPEGLARRLRYRALAALAHAHSLRFIATAHHADDQLESTLMALMRGAGPRGLRGIAPAATLRSPSGPLRLVRPMLRTSHADALRLCAAAGWTWRDDSTNRDDSRLRAALRSHVIPQLKELRPGVELRVAANAPLLADAARIARGRVHALLKNANTSPAGLEWPRARLRRETPLVIGDLVRLAAAKLLADNGDKGRPADGGNKGGPDHLSNRVVSPCVQAIRDTSTDPRQFTLGSLVLGVGAHHVSLIRLK